jgi:hypothetical protein
LVRRRIGYDEFMSKDAEAKGRLWFMAGKLSLGEHHW